MAKTYRMINDKTKQTVEVPKGALQAYKNARWRVLEDVKSKSNTKKTTTK
jgi:hypothetical protein